MGEGTAQVVSYRQPPPLPGDQYLQRVQLACTHYRAITVEEARRDFTQIGAECYCLICRQRRQVTRREPTHG